MPERRNLVFICTDQQRTDTMAAYGNDWIETPHLNNLSSRSFIFENAYITQPVCSPARASIMTGLYPHSAGVIKNSNPDRPNSNLTPEVRTIAEMISDEYLCAYFGKWHLGRRPVRAARFRAVGVGGRRARQRLSQLPP